MEPWWVYIVQCSDENKSLYTGISNDVEKRIAAHNAGTGAKYTRGRTPVVLLKTFKCPDKSAALKLEIKIKKLSREEKLNLNETSLVILTTKQTSIKDLQ
jgi:putative endonuclease